MYYFQLIKVAILHELIKDYIDVSQGTLYYSPMLLKSPKLLVIFLFIFAISSGLSGCGSIKKASKSITLPKIIKSKKTEPDTVEKPNIQVEDVVNNNVGAKSIEPITTSGDLLDRIRSGFSLPGLKSKYVRDYEKWNASHPTYLNDLFKRSEPFLYHIVEEVEKRGLPMEIALFPAIESAFKPNAISRSKAAGLWQFIPSTGQGFGLRQDWWYDERRDTLSATQAALDYLEQLYDIFDGDWFLAIAAYNAGQGTVLKAIKANKRKRKKTDFQSLKLRSETRRYVPKLIALRNVVENPARFEVSLPSIANAPYFDVITLPGQVDLKQFSQSINYDHNSLKRLNAGFLRWATSPDGPHRIIVPLAYSQASKQSSVISNDSERIRYHQHIIEPGDTLSDIAQRYGVSVNAIKQTNNLNSHLLRLGSVLLIPISHDEALIANSKPSSKSQIVDPSKQNEVIHYVKRGDTLWSISRSYQVGLQELLRWNNLSVDQTLSLNQALTIFTNTN